MAKGGNRIGAGRPKGSANIRDSGGVRLSLIAQPHAELAISTLVNIMERSRSDAARVSAACAILDRGYGRPPTQGAQIEVVEPERVFRTVEEIRQELKNRGVSLRLLKAVLENKGGPPTELEEPTANNSFFAPK
jgi:hypothetical protein